MAKVAKREARSSVGLVCYTARRKSSIAVLTVGGRSCCVQWPQPGTMTV